MRVLLVVEPPTRPGVSTTVMPPLGVLSVAASLEARGIPCDVLDRNIDRRAIPDDRYDVVGFSVNITNVGTTLQTVNELRGKPRRPRIVAGGPFCLTHAPLLVTSGVDAAVIGEGEDTLYEYLVARDPTSVPGLCLADGDRAYTTPPRPWEDNLDRFPPPALHKVDIRKYRSPFRRALPISSVLTSRGCPYECIFCFHAMGRKFRKHSPARVVDEIEWQVRELGVREVCVQDDNFTLDIPRAKEICRLVAGRSLNVRLQLRAGVRADRLTEELCHLLKEAGAWLVTVSPETGSDEGLRRIKKGFTMEDVRQAISWCRRAKLAVLTCFMVGFPWEGPADISQTLNAAFELNADFVQVARVRPFPGTELYGMVNLLREGDTLADTPGLFRGALDHRTGVDERELCRLLRAFHRSFYLRPRRLWRMVRLLPLSGLWELGHYALVTGNV